MKCNSCGSEFESGWRYCPKCGATLRTPNFSDIFSRMRKEMIGMTKDIDSTFDKDIEAFDISPFFKKPMKQKGFSIRIHTGTGMEPKIQVKTFGDVDKEMVRKHVEQMGYNIKKPIPVRVPQNIPKTTEEPATDVKRLDSKVVVTIDIPGVKREDDIQITELEASVEVKAIAGDKAYFKILTVPEQYSLVTKKFSKGKLHLEFA